LQIQNKITEEHNNFRDSNRKIVKRDRVNSKTQYEELATQVAKYYVTKKNVPRKVLKISINMNQVSSTWQTDIVNTTVEQQ
jgi:hypothetical protein